MKTENKNKNMRPKKQRRKNAFIIPTNDFLENDLFLSPNQNRYLYLIDFLGFQGVISKMVTTVRVIGSLLVGVGFDPITLPIIIRGYLRL